MESAHKTLIVIASASQRIANTLDRNVGRKTTESAQLDKIFLGTRTVLEALNKTLLLKDGNADDQLADWLNSEEPQACLRTLNQIEEILNKKPEYGLRGFFNASPSTHTQDKNDEAMRLFQMRKSYFHFLLMAGIWNREGGVQQRPQDIPQRDALNVSNGVDGRDLVPVTQCNSGDLPHIAQTRKGGMVEENKRLKLEKVSDILEWLDAWKPRGTHDRTIPQRQPGTCTWLFNRSAYKTWRDTENSFLWLHGKPGAGKSVLAASVIEDLKDNLQAGDVLGYFYCDFREERSTSAAETMRSLLSQLLQHLRRQMVDPGDLIDKLVEERDEGASTINNTILLARHVSRVVKQFPRQPFLVIDALDECKDVNILLKALDGLRKGGMRLFVTSRPHQNIKDSLSAFPFIDLEVMKYWMSADIRLHVARELDSRRRLRSIDASLKEKIYSKLCNQAGGMFRWVQCQLSTMERCVTAVEIREALEDLPGDLDMTYERILLDIDITQRGGKVARRALDWLIAALRPLQLSEIMEGVSIDPEQRTMERDSGPLHGSALLDVLGALVMYDEVTDIVLLSHFSVKEYLIAETTRIKYPTYHIEEQGSHTQIALLCMCYIGVHLRCGRKSIGYEGQKRYELFSLSSESHSLLSYALNFGFDHLAHVSPCNMTILHAIKDFQSDAEQQHRNWKQLCEYALRANILPHLALRHDLGLCILIAYAPEPLFRSFIRLSHAKLQPRDGTNPLIYAACFDKIEHARTLVSNGADVNSRGWDIYGSHRHPLLPLEAAIRSGHPAMVDFFLGEGSHVPNKLFADAIMVSSTFPIASIVSRLLQTDEFVEWAAEIQDEELLLRALDQNRYVCYKGGLSEQDIDIIERRLTQLGCKPPPRSDEASLRYAVSEGHVSTVRHMLLQAIHFPPDIILDASYSRGPNSTMIRILLNAGCQADVTSSVGDTPLHLVLRPQLSGYDCLENIQLLIDAGCNPSACNLAGKTPLHLAARHGYSLVVEYLLSRQVPLPPDILLVASNATVTHFLIRKGADVHTVAANGETPLHSAMKAVDDDESLDCAGTLIDAGCNPRLPDATGETAIDVAAERGHLRVVRHLLSINISLPPGVLLHVPSESLAKLLIDNGADVHATRPNGDTLLHLCMTIVPETECLKRVKFLVNAGCDPHACNLHGRTPFHLAAREGYISVMEYLLSLGVSVPSDAMLTQFERTIFGIPRRYLATRFLLDKGGDVHTTSETGDTLLHLSADHESEHDALEFTKFLVDAGCDPSTINSRNETPLHIAARRGHITIVDYYLSLGISLPSDIVLAAAAGWASEKAQVVRYLIEKGADASVATTDKDTPLHLLETEGIINGNEYLGCIKILMDAGCDPCARNLAGETPLHAAARRGSITVLKFLLLQGVPLPHDILRTSAPSMFRSLISKGADARCVGTNVDMQLMHRALNFGNEEDCLECAKTLVGAGWDPSLKNAAGQTPIHVAARQGHISVIKYLLSQGATLPPDILLAGLAPSNEFRHRTPKALIRFLICEGADVNAATSDRNTPLHLALPPGLVSGSARTLDRSVVSRLWEVVEILLNCGANPSARNAGGQTPFDIAEANGHFFNENFLRLVRKAHRIQSSSSVSYIPG